MLSIIIAFGKGKEYLKDCFDSIKEQDYKDIETVLVLDKANINPEENIEELISEFSQSINLKVYERLMESMCISSIVMIILWKIH